MKTPVLEYTPEETFALPFSIERHKKTFVNYTELVINRDGEIMYATPSHEQKLIKIILENNPDMTYNDLMDEAYKTASVFNWMNWLMNKSGCMVVYTNGIAYYKSMTKAQIEAVRELYHNGLTSLRRISL